MLYGCTLVALVIGFSAPLADERRASIAVLLHPCRTKALFDCFARLQAPTAP
jgi:hypothetical protein